MMVGLNSERILQGLEMFQIKKDCRAYFNESFRLLKPNVSDKVLRIIVSYTDYVKMFGNE